VIQQPSNQFSIKKNKKKPTPISLIKLITSKKNPNNDKREQDAQ